MSRCSFKSILLFSFLNGIEPFFDRHLFMWRSTKRSSIFDLRPLTPKIYSQKLALRVIESVIIYMDVCHGSVGQSVHTKTCMWVGPTLVAMATIFGLGAESRRLPACLLCFQLWNPEYLLAVSVARHRRQWRRQTIKLGSAFKGELYFQVGQMEGPTIPSDSRECAKRRGGRFGKGRHSPSPRGLWAMPQKNFQKSTLKSRVFFAFFCKLKWFHLQRRQVNFD